MWSRFWRLSGFERGLVMESAAILIATWAGLRLLGFRRWKRFLGWLSPAKRGAEGVAGSDQVSLARVVARREESAARHLFYQPNCLEQSLTLWWLLRLRSIPSEIRIGGRKSEDRFEAHAWVECGGEVLSSGGEGHLHFVPFDEPIPNWETSAH
ncbi:MAG TPA: lasso peptide biosynthesis B2 protein [Candidatus Acidoferrales bacterium]|nr:lasso peptide biosynthesis B2 protein [Candidatus Acidoferrales bacterium]